MPHIKDKNLYLAKTKVDALKEADLKKLTMPQLVAIIKELGEVESALKVQAALVKEHCNKVYTPMCEKKRELEIEFAFLSAKLEKIKEVNPTFAAILKLSS
jgi:hypothetical protein